MFNFIILFTIACHIFVCYKFIKYFKKIEKEMELQDKINSLLGQRMDVISDQLDTLYEMVKLESKRLDIHNDDNDDANWWKNK